MDLFDNVDNIIDVGKKAMGFIGDSNEVLDRLGVGVGTKVVSGMLRETIENDVREAFSTIRRGSNILMGVLVLAIIILFWFIYLETERPDEALKYMTYFTVAGIGVVSCMLVGTVVLSSSIDHFGESLFGDKGSIYKPIRDINQKSILM